MRTISVVAGLIAMGLLAAMQASRAESAAPRVQLAEVTASLAELDRQLDGRGALSKAPVATRHRLDAHRQRLLKLLEDPEVLRSAAQGSALAAAFLEFQTDMADAVLDVPRCRQYQLVGSHRWRMVCTTQREIEEARELMRAGLSGPGVSAQALTAGGKDSPPE